MYNVEKEVFKMKEHYKEIVKKVLEIIKEGIEDRKDVDAIKLSIYLELLDSNLGISNIEYFDKYYFRVLMGVRLSTYIKQQQMEYASNIYECASENRVRQRDTFYNVSRFKKKYELRKDGKNMKKYMVTDMFNIENEDLRWMSNNGSNERIYFVDASSKEEAIFKYLSTKCEFEPGGILKEMLFRDFWVSVGYGEYEYTEKFQKAKEISVLADVIYSEYFENNNKSPEKLFLEYETEDLANKYWGFLEKEDIKTAYYMCNLCEVFCVEMGSLAEYKRRERKNLKNIIDDIQDEDILGLNMISKLIREKCEGDCQLSVAALADIMGQDEAKELLEYCASRNFRSVVNLTYEDGSFIFCSLIDSMEISYSVEEVEAIDIRPSRLFMRLIEEGYDFREGKNALAIKLISEEMGNK